MNMVNKLIKLLIVELISHWAWCRSWCPVATSLVTFIAFVVYAVASPPPIRAISTTIQISEVEADPILGGTDTANEWFELTNVSSSSITLDGWTISDNNATDTIPTITLGPGECVVVAATSAGFLSEHPGFGIFLTLADGAIGSGLANGGDELVLRDNLNDIIDCVSWGSNTNCFAPSVSSPPSNTSQTIQRTSATDTDTAADWSAATETPCTITVTVSTLNSFTAAQINDRILLKWQTGHEMNNLGFNIYREQDGERIRVTPSLIAGSALLTGPGVALMAGRSYQWWETLPQSYQDIQYWLEEVDLDGKSAWHGPITVEHIEGADPLPAQSELLNALSHSSSEVNAAKSVEKKASPPEQTPAGLQKQSSLAAQPAIKLAIRDEGWYRVTQAELITAGLDSNVDPRLLQLYVDGQEVPMIVMGQEDGRLDPTEAIEFYGVGLDSASTDKRTYWLLAGSQPGRRAVHAQTQTGMVSVGGFPSTVERKDRSVYFASLRNGEEENFFGAMIAQDPVDQSVLVQHLDPSSPEDAALELALQGVTTTPHRVKVLFNGAEVGEVIFAGQAKGLARFSLAPGQIIEGQNQVRLIAQSGEHDISVVDYIRLTYWHTFTADDNALRFTASGGQRVTVGGFTQSGIRVVDVTNPDAVQLVAAEVQPQGAGFAATLTVPAGGPKTLWAFTDAWVKQPVSVTPNQPSNWRRVGLGADLVIISHRDFVTSIEPLRALRHSQGWSVAVVDVEDIYDEFSFGQKTPAAVKEFLSFARENWERAPRFVLLVGDASLDPKNYLGVGDFDFMPTKLFDSRLMETASDDWLADFDGDALVEMVVGRLPVRTVREATTIVAKIMSYERSDPFGSALLIADKNSGYDFEVANAQLRELIPTTVTIEEIRRGRVDDATARSQLLESLNRGPFIVNYLGHGSVDFWGGNLLTSADARALDNGERLSLFVMMTCLNGYFQDVALESLAESLIKAERGGAVAVWASSGLTRPVDQMLMNQELYRLVFQGGATLTLGEATAGAKAAVNDLDTRRTWILLGDPTMRLVP